MTDTLIQAARALAEVLAAENAALEVHDHLRATALLPGKQRLMAAFDSARVAAVPLPPGAATDDIREIGLALKGLAARNVRLLEQAMEVQSRVIGIVAAAARQQVREMNPPPRYGRPGRLPPASRPMAYAMVSRA